MCFTENVLPWEDESLDDVEETRGDKFIVPVANNKERIDIVVASQLGCSRSMVQDWIKRGLVEIEGRAVVRSSEKVRTGQQVSVERPPLVPAIPQPDDTVPIDVVYEDSSLLVVNKGRGITVHPGSGTHGGTLVNGLLSYCRDLSGIRGVERPGIVHRLDKDTSGLLVVAKNDEAHVDLSQQFAERRVLKVYLALVHGIPPMTGTIDQPIGRHQTDRKKMAVRRGGRSARTDYRVLEMFGTEYSLIEVHLHSGRTHQIRVHMTWLGFPLVGDPVYGKRSNPWNLQGQALHCCRLGFIHPVDKRNMEFTAELPEVLENIVAELRDRYGRCELNVK